MSPAERRSRLCSIAWGLRASLRQLLEEIDAVDAEIRTTEPPTIAELLDRKSLVAAPEMWLKDDLECVYSFRAKSDRYRQPPRPQLPGVDGAA